MLEDGTISLRDAIITELDQSYRMIDLVGKHYPSIFFGVLSLIGAVSISTINQMFSEWIFTSNIFFIGIVLVFIINSLFQFRGNQFTQINESNATKEQNAINLLMVFDASMTYLEALIRAVRIIIVANLMIMMLYLGNLVTGNFAILQEKISIGFLSIPAEWWFAIQTGSFLVIAWFFTTKGKILRFTLRDTFSRFFRQPLTSEFQDMKIPLYLSGLFIFSLLFFGISVLLTTIEFSHLVSNWILIAAILIAQTVIVALLNDYFSASIVVRQYFYKLYQLNTALALIESQVDDQNNNNSYEDAKLIYHTSRLFFPIKMNWWIFFSNYLLIPNVAYLKEEYQDIITKYLTKVF